MSDKPVLFASFRLLERAENIRAIYNAYNGSKTHIMSTDPNYVSEVRSGRYDIMVTDDFPAVTPGKCIMIWHGIQGGKYIGLDQPGSPYYSIEFLHKMSYIISAGTGMISAWHKSTGLPVKNILPLGMPRTDQYVGKRKGNGHTFLASKRSYLFVPTFRDNGETPFPAIDWDYIDHKLTDDELFAVKVHPWSAQYSYDHVTKRLEAHRRKHIIEISGTEPSAPYLYDADVVITDYSSIMFDAYLLNKPVVLFEKLLGYTETRGMYMRYPDEYCSWYAINEAQMIELARTAYHAGLLGTEKKCIRTVADACDGHACERICKLIELLKGEI